MKKLNYFKAGAIAYMLLGFMHLVSQMQKDGLSENVLQTLMRMKNTTFHFMGQHDLMQFYTGFSITMGFMLFAFGLQTFLINKPSRQIIVADILISLVVLILSIIYFHPLAYSFIAFSLLCFVICLLKPVNDIKN